VFVQATHPVANSLGWSSLVAAIPIVVLFVLLGGLSWRAERATGAALLAAVAIAASSYGMNVLTALDVALYGAAFGILAVLWVIVNAIWIYNTTVASGHFSILRQAFLRIGDTHEVQVLIIAYCFGGLLEGLIGAGAPVAICAAMLVGIGFPPVKAAVAALIADSVPVAFGTLALPLTALSTTTGLPLSELGAMVGRQTPLLALLVPFVLLFVIGGPTSLRAEWRIALVSGLSFAGMQFTASNFISVQLADVLAALTSALVLLAYLRLAGRQYTPATSTAPSRKSEAASTPVLHAEARATSAGDHVHVDTTGGRELPFTSTTVAQAFAPYLIIIVVFVAVQFEPLKSMLAKGVAIFDWPGLHIANNAGKPIATAYRFNWLPSTGTLLFICGILTALTLGVGMSGAWRSFVATLRQLGSAALTVMSIFALAYVANLSGQTTTLGLFLAGVGGTAFAFISPVIGWIGSALTGSDSSANVLFGNLQTAAAKQTGISPILAAASNSSGGVVAKAISVQSLAVAAATVKLVGSEGVIFRKVLGWSLGLLVLMCFISVLESLPSISSWIVP
jgi:lactate permease